MKLLERVKIPEQVNKTTPIIWWTTTESRYRKILCMDPKIMLFDEPTSALDPEMISEVLML